MSQISVNTITPVNRHELVRLSEKGKANPKVVRTLKVKTVLESKFRHLNYIRNLAPHVIDEPPGLLGDDTAPNPSEAVLAALGSLPFSWDSCQRRLSQHPANQSGARAGGRH